MTLIQVAGLGLARLGAGFVAGLVGVGGGAIFTPVLFFGYGALGVPEAVRTPLTVGTGLLLAGPTVLGAQGGAALAHRIETGWLRGSLAALAIVVAGWLVCNAIG